MTREEYDKRMDIYSMKLGVEDDEDLWNEIREEMSDFQREYMMDVFHEYEKKTKENGMYKYITELLWNAITNSTTGQAIVDVPKENAEEIDQFVWSEIGDMLLDSQNYDYGDGDWVVDCMFGGNYVPHWDGWE